MTIRLNKFFGCTLTLPPVKAIIFQPEIEKTVKFSASGEIFYNTNTSNRL